MTLADIAHEIKASIAHNPEAATIQFDQSNIRFLGLEEGADPTRVKTLGVFEVELTLKDVPALERRIEVRRETKDESDGSSES